MNLTVGKSPSDELSLTNCVVVNPEDASKLDPKFDFGSPNGDSSLRKSYVKLKPEGSTVDYIYALVSSSKMRQGCVGLSFIQRKWIAGARIDYPVSVESCKFGSQSILASVTFVVDFLQKAKVTKEPYSTDKMVDLFKEQFFSLPFSQNQEMIFKFENKPLLNVKVKSIQVFDPATLSGGNGGTLNAKIGILHGNTQLIFDKTEDSIIQLTGKARGKVAMPTIINPDWDFSKMGIGGLDREFSAIFRRAFASRVFPSDVVEQLGMCLFLHT